MINEQINEIAALKNENENQLDQIMSLKQKSVSDTAEFGKNRNLKN